MSNKDVLAQMGNRIADRRKELSMTQENLAEAVGLSLQSISCIELGKKGVRPENLIKICEILDVSSDYLLLGKRDFQEMSGLYALISQLEPADYKLVEQIVIRLQNK